MISISVSLGTDSAVGFTEVLAVASFRDTTRAAVGMCHGLTLFIMWRCEAVQVAPPNNTVAGCFCGKKANMARDVASFERERMQFQLPLKLTLKFYAVRLIFQRILQLVSDSRACALIFPVLADCFLVPGCFPVFSIDATIVSQMSTLPVVSNNTVHCNFFFKGKHDRLFLNIPAGSNQFSNTNRGPGRRISQRLALLPQSSEWLPVVNSPTVETTDENITVLPVFPLSSVWLGEQIDCVQLKNNKLLEKWGYNVTN